MANTFIGNYYQWNTVTTSTGDAITSGQAENSICAKGWRLPTSGSGGEFEVLVTVLGGTSSTDNITKAPFYGVRGGLVSQDTGYLFAYPGNGGGYWSSTPYSNDIYAYFFNFNGTNGINPSNTGARNVGRSVRCVAQ